MKKKIERERVKIKENDTISIINMDKIKLRLFSAFFSKVIKNLITLLKKTN